jgi:hypothetical protein
VIVARIGRWTHRFLISPDRVGDQVGQ